MFNKPLDSSRAVGVKLNEKINCMVYLDAVTKQYIYIYIYIYIILLKNSSVLIEVCILRSCYRNFKSKTTFHFIICGRGAEKERERAQLQCGSKTETIGVAFIDKRETGVLRHP